MANTSLNGSDKSVNITLTGSNLIATATSGASGYVRAVDLQVTGKFYFEMKPTVWVGANTAMGMAGNAAAVPTPSGGTPVGLFTVYKSGAIWYNNAATGLTLGARAANDVIGFAINLTDRLGWARVAPSGNWNGSATADPVTNVGGVPLYAFGIGLPGIPVICLVANLDSITANFGDTAYTGTAPTGYTAGFTSAATAPNSAVASQLLVEHWITDSPQAQVGQIFVEHWRSVATGSLAAIVSQVFIEHWHSVANVVPAAGGPKVTMF